MPAGSKFWIEEGMLSDTIRNVDVNGDDKVDFVCFTVRNQFLHPNHPLGWIRKLTVTIDGKEVPEDEVYFVVRGQWVNARHVPTITDIYWYMREEAAIYVQSTGVKAGKHRVTCSLSICLFTHALIDTKILDPEGMFPRLTATLSGEMVAC